MKQIFKFLIPKTYKQTIEKLDKFIPPEVFRSKLFPAKFETFTRDAMQVKVYPFDNPDVGYIICLEVEKRTSEMVKFFRNSNASFTIRFERLEESPIPWEASVEISVPEARPISDLSKRFFDQLKSCR
jgi:hypothetical protein